MKILYLITRAERGGAQMHLLDLIRGFREHCKIELAAGDDGFLLDEARQLGIHCYVLPSLVRPISPKKDMLALREIMGLLRKTRPDLIHAHTSKAGILGRLGAWVCNIPVVFTAHTWCFAEGTSWKWKLLGAPFERIAAMPGGPIINVSEANRDLALRYRVASPSRLITIHNGVPDEQVASRRNPIDTPIIIMVARFAAPKDQALLLEACADLKSPFRLQFAGAGPTRLSTERRVQQLGLEQQVEFLGDRPDIPKRLHDASIFALATNWEGLPLSILEAMRAGLPVVATGVGGVREAIRDGENGFLIARGDRTAFTHALELLLNDAGLRARFGRTSRRIFEERFTAEQMLRKTFTLYRQVVSSPVNDYETLTAGRGV